MSDILDLEPIHLEILVNKDGQGPLGQDDITVFAKICWCRDGKRCKVFPYQLV